MSLTLQKRFAIALLSLGFAEQKPTARFRVFKGYHPSLNGTTPIERWYYLGKSGALRWNSTGKVSETRECSEKTRERLLNLPATPNQEVKGFLIKL